MNAQSFYEVREAMKKALELCREQGMIPTITLNIATGTADEAREWAEYCAGFVALWRKSDPQLKRVQIWNEPNASWFLDKRLSQETSAAGLHIEMANKVARAIKARIQKKS